MCSGVCVGGCSCYSNSTRLPIGPSGDSGTNGINGLNGTSILYAYNSNSGVGTPASTVETILGGFTIPADKFNPNSNEIEVYFYMEYTNNDQVDLKIKLGGLTIYTEAVIGASDYKAIYKLKMNRISSTSQLWTLEKLVYTGSAIDGLINIQTSAADETVSNTFQITAQNTTPIANQLKLKKLIAYNYLS